MARRYRCVAIRLFLPLSGGMTRGRCQSDAITRIRVTWASGKVNIRQVCPDHADGIRRQSAKMIGTGSVRSVTETAI